MASRPGLSASGQRIMGVSRVRRGSIAARWIRLEPPCQVITTWDGKSFEAAMAVFSPSTMRTGSVGRRARRWRLNRGTSSGAVQPFQRQWRGFRGSGGWFSGGKNRRGRTSLEPSGRSNRTT